MKKILKAFTIIIFLPITILVIIILINYTNTAGLNHPAENVKDAIHQLNFLEYQLKNHDLGNRMQNQFPEGFIFINVLYGIAWTEIGSSPHIDDSVYNRAMDESRYAYDQINTKAAREPFNATLIPEYGMFYRGWSNYLLGKILKADTDRDSSEIAVFKLNCEDIAKSISDSTFLFPQSHYEGCWPADAFIGVASLKLHDELLNNLYDSLIMEWIQRVKSNVDPASGMIPHSVDCNSTEIFEIPRGSSMSLMLIFLQDIDSSFAQEQFTLYKEHFLIHRAGFPAVREFLPTQDVVEDYDSGPVIWDISFPGSIVSIGAFKKFGDLKTANAQFQTIEAFGFPITFKKRKKYLFGQQPIADAFIVWARLQE